MNIASPLGLALDLAGTFAFALNGALTAVRVARVDIVGVITLGVITALGGGIVRDVLLGAITAVGGGTIRDVLVRRVPTVLQSELYAIPALLGALVVVVASALDAPALLGALLGGGLCLAVRLAGVRFRLDAPRPRGGQAPEREA